MIRNISRVFVILLATFLYSDAADQPDLSTITEKNLKAQVRFLSHDLFEGRGTATRGYDLAALYVATQFEQLGIQPGGSKGTYLQQVPLQRTTIVPEQCSFLIQGKQQVTLKYGDHYLMSADYLRETSSVSAEVVFAGYGITAPDLKYDDYKGIDAKGKIVVLISSAPDFFPISERAHFASSATKQTNAVAHGAIGIITFHNPVDEQRTPWARSVRQNKLSGYRWVNAMGNPNDTPAEIRANVSLSRAGAMALFEHSPVTLKQVDEMWSGKRIRSFPLNLTVSLKSGSKLEKATSPNVIGVLSGSDPVLKNEYVVLTAHLDHIGISDPVNNDTINNGAYDNSTGIACLIEMARAFVHLKTKPRRSILFVALTAEEKGLQGAYYFASNPTVPIESIVANVNTDMFLMLFPFADAVALGAEHSTMGRIAQRAFQQVGLKMRPDPAPEEVRFVRSDQYAFIKKGIPAIKLMAGFESLDRKVNGEEATRNWLKTIYHSPQDESHQTMNWESGIKIVKATFLIGYETANQIARPEWNAGDFFGRTFKPAGK